MFYFSYNCCRSDMDREGEQRVCVMVVHAGVFIEFGAILMKPFISELIACSGAWSYTAAVFRGQNVRAFLLVFPERAAPSWLYGAARRRAAGRAEHQGQGMRVPHRSPRFRTAPPALSQLSRVPHSLPGSLTAPRVPHSPPARHIPPVRAAAAPQGMR